MTSTGWRERRRETSSGAHAVMLSRNCSVVATSANSPAASRRHPSSWSTTNSVGDSVPSASKRVVGLVLVDGNP